MVQNVVGCVLCSGPQSSAGVLENGPHAVLLVETEGLGCGGFDVSLWMERMFSLTCVSTNQSPSSPQFPATDRAALPGTLTHRRIDLQKSLH